MPFSGLLCAGLWKRLESDIKIMGKRARKTSKHDAISSHTKHCDELLNDPDNFSEFEMFVTLA